MEGGGRRPGTARSRRVPHDARGSPSSAYPTVWDPFASGDARTRSVAPASLHYLIGPPISSARRSFAGLRIT